MFFDSRNPSKLSAFTAQIKLRDSHDVLRVMLEWSRDAKNYSKSF